MRVSIGICSDGSATVGRVLRALEHRRNAAIRLKRSTSISGSYSSPAIGATRPSGRCHCASRSVSRSCSSSAAALIPLVLEQPAHERLARILLGVLLRRIGPRQQHPRLDVDERRRHHQELAGDVEIQLLHQVEVLEVLRR